MSTKNEETHEDRTLNNKRSGLPIGGIILTVLGIIFLLNNYGFSSIDIGKLWPLILIIVGLGVLFKYRR